MQAELFFDAGAELAECPVWDDRTNELVWVDILRGEIHRTSEDGTHDRVIEMGEHVGCVALTENGGMVAGTKSGFRRVDEDAGHPLLAALPDAGPNIRMNDGKVDPAGRFVAGTMTYDETPGAGSLWSFDGNGVERLLTGVTISNGLAWSADGGTMYYVDTPTQRVDAFDYDSSSGRLKNRRPFWTSPDPRHLPDGLTIDEEGGIWVALWEGAIVIRIDPSGQLTHQVRTGSTRPTSVALGGVGLSVLFITTSGNGRCLRPRHHPGAIENRVLSTTKGRRTRRLNLA